jgi:hypothetical protein
MNTYAERKVKLVTPNQWLKVQSQYRAVPSDAGTPSVSLQK